MIQKAVNYIYRYPKDSLKQITGYGGIINYLYMLILEKRMKHKSLSLVVTPPITTNKSITIQIVTGKKYWHQTVFCAYSIQKVSPYPINFIFYDDGSFDKKLISQIQKQVQLSTIYTVDQLEQKLEEIISIRLYPNIHHKRKVYPHIKKIVDIASMNNGYMLEMDSDLLFFKNPTELFNHYFNSNKSIFMKQHINSYGYSFELMESLTNNNVTQFINVGIVGIDVKLINWDNLEKWISILEHKEGKSYFLEQALWAMLVANKNEIELLNQDNYQVMPSKIYDSNTEIIARHYVSYSKIIYYKDALNLFKNVR